MPGASWTDENAPDPGITLLELFAFLACALGAALVAWRVAARLSRAGRRGCASPHA